MQALHKALLSTALLGILTFSTQADATMADTFYLDSLQIDKCLGSPSCTTSTIYQNGFDGNFSGAATPSTVNYANGASSAWGSTAGSTFSENGNSKLALGGTQAVQVTASISGKQVYTNQAQLQTPKISDTNALGKGRDFSVTTVWDLAAPTENGARYGLRLNDQNSTSPGAPNNNDILDIAVVNHGGSSYIQVRDLLADGTPAGDNLLASVALDLLSGYDQIALQLSWIAGSPGTASASYAYGTSGSFGSATSLGSWGGVLFSDDSFTRARVYASAPVTVVSAPQIWLLLGSGLLMIGCRADKKKSRNTPV